MESKQIKLIRESNSIENNIIIGRNTLSEREIFRSFLFMEILIKLVIGEKASVAVAIAKVILSKNRRKRIK